MRGWGKDRSGLYLDRGDGYMAICICQNSLNCTLKIDAFCCVKMIKKIVLRGKKSKHKISRLRTTKSFLLSALTGTDLLQGSCGLDCVPQKS